MAAPVHPDEPARRPPALPSDDSAPPPIRSALLSALTSVVDRPAPPPAGPASGLPPAGPMPTHGPPPGPAAGVQRPRRLMAAVESLAAPPQPTSGVPLPGADGTDGPTARAPVPGDHPAPRPGMPLRYGGPGSTSSGAPATAPASLPTHPGPAAHLSGHPGPTAHAGPGHPGPTGPLTADLGQALSAPPDARHLPPPPAPGPARSSAPPPPPPFRGAAGATRPSLRTGAPVEVLSGPGNRWSGEASVDEERDEGFTAIKERAQQSLLDGLGARLYDPSMTEDVMTDLVAEHLEAFFAGESIAFTEEERHRLDREITDDLLRHGPIEPFLADPSIGEIMVNGAKQIYVERRGKLVLTRAQFRDDAQLRRVIERIVSRVGRRIDESSPMVDARLPDGSRVNAIIPPLAVDGPSLTIRKFTADNFTIDDLVRTRSVTPQVATLIEICVRGRLNVLVSGGTGSGKTTLLNILSSFIPSDERIVTIEDAVELRLRQPHVIRLESRPPNVEGKGAVLIRDLVRNSLRMRPDRVVIGECRGGETLDMLQAMNTGHDGSLTTLHANSPRDALSRIETMVLMAGMDLPIRAIREQVASAVDLIVHTSRLRDGSRRVTHLSEVVGMEGDTITMNDVFVLNEYGDIDENGLFTGTLKPTGIRPAFIDRLTDHGVHVPPDMFGDSYGVQFGTSGSW